MYAHIYYIRTHILYTPPYKATLHDHTPVVMITYDIYAHLYYIRTNIHMITYTCAYTIYVTMHYRVAKTHVMPYLYRPFCAKEPCN